jgi:hypothetical protein
MMMVTSALRDKASRRSMLRLSSSSENPYVTLSSLEEDETESKFGRFGIIKPGTASVSPPSSTRSVASVSSILKKGFSDTDSGISNTASSSCESFQSDPYYLPDPARDVLYDNSFHLPPTSEFDPEEEDHNDDEDDDFDRKLSLSLANLGIGIGNNVVRSINDCSMPNEEDYYENVGWVDYANLNINLDEIGVDFDIVEPPPAFAETNTDNEIRQLVVDSEADEVVEELGENCENNGDETEDRDANENYNDDGIDESLEDLGGVLRDLITQCNSSPLLLQNPSANSPHSHNRTFSPRDTFNSSPNKPTDDGEAGGGSSSGRASKYNGNDSVPGRNNGGDRGSGNSHKKSDGSSSSFSANGKKKRKRERYEIRLGYACYDLELNDKHVFIYSLQKNKDMMEDLLGHSKLKNSK